MDATSTQIYLEILEKTNQQLSLWNNPYGLMVGILTALVAIMAVGFTILFWRQGREYKDVLDKFFNEQEKSIQTKIDSLTRAVLNERMERLNEEIDGLTGQAREQVQQEIDAIRTAREAIRLPRPILSGITDPLAVRSAVSGGYGGSNQSSLTESQVRAIVSLLASFGADDPTIENVERILSGRL